MLKLYKYVNVLLNIKTKKPKRVLLNVIPFTLRFPSVENKNGK